MSNRGTNECFGDEDEIAPPSESEKQEAELRDWEGGGKDDESHPFNIERERLNSIIRKL